MKKLFISFLIAATAFILLASGIKYALDMGLDEYIFPPDFPSDFPQSRSVTAVEYRYYYDQLSDDEKQAYRCIYNEIEAHPEKIRIPLITAEQMSNVFNALSYDNPSLICIEDGSSIQTAGKLCWFLPKYIWSVEECDERSNTMMDAARLFISKTDEAMSDFDKEKILHDALVEKCVYTAGENYHTAYGALVDGEATCAGYAKGMQLLLNMSGIKSCLILGEAKNPGREMEGHAWNIVWIDDKPYHLDVTWDDPIVNGEDGEILYNYFNLTDKEISATHGKFSFEPNCVYTEANYFRRSGLFFEKYDDDITKKIELKFKEAVGKGHMKIELKFADRDLLDAVFESVVEEQEIYAMIRRIKRETGANIKQDSLLYSKVEDYNILHLVLIPEE